MKKFKLLVCTNDLQTYTSSNEITYGVINCIRTVDDVNFSLLVDGEPWHYDAAFELNCPEHLRMLADYLERNS